MWYLYFLYISLFHFYLYLFNRKVWKPVRWVRDNPWIRDALVTIQRLQKIYYSDFLTDEQKARNICRILGSYIFGVIGERLPLPGICGYIGNVVGAIVGEVVFSVGKYISSWF